VVHSIKLGQKLGFTLAELNTLLANVAGGRAFCALVQEAYEDKIELMGKQIERLKTMRKELKKLSLLA
jgi:DNA-binding transcriptional MerR regulator